MQRQYFYIIFVFFIGITLSMTLFLYAKHLERHHIYDEFQDVAQEYTFIIRNKMQKMITITQALTHYYKESIPTTEKEFKQLTQLIAQISPHIDIGWTVYVPNKDRIDYETYMQQLYPNFKFVEYDETDKLIPVTQRDFYLPLIYIVTNGEDYLQGFDYSTLPNWWDTVKKARDQGTFLASPPTQIATELNTKNYSIGLVSPIYKQGLPIETMTQRQQAFHGAISTIARIQALIDTTRPYFSHYHNDLAIHIKDITEPSAPILVYEHNPILKNHDVLTYSTAFKLLDRVLQITWKIDLMQSTHFYNHRPYYILLIGLLITFFVVSYLYKSLSYTHLLEKEIKCRTQSAIEKEKLLRSIIDNLPQLIFWKDKNSIYIGGNKKLVTINQFASTDDINGKTDFDMIWQEQAHAHQKLDHQLMEKDEVELRVVERITYQNGISAWLEMNRIPLHDINGQVIGILGTAEDVTRRQEAEILLQEYNQRLEKEVERRTQALLEKNEQLQVAHERFTAVLDGLEAVVYVADIETYEILFINKYAQNLFGKEKGNMIGKKCWQVLQNAAQKCEMCNVDEQVVLSRLEIGKTSWEHYNRVTKSWFLIQDRRIQWINGRTVRLSIFTDITERKKTEQNLQRALEWRSAIFNNSSIGILIGTVVDNTHKIIEVNDKLIEITGYPREELLGYTSEILFPDYQSFSKINTHFCQEGVQNQNGYFPEVKLIRKDGSAFWVEINGRFIKRTTTLDSFIWIIADITERKQAEHALRASEERFNLAMQGANDAVWDWNIQTNKVYYSERWRTIIGYSSKELAKGFKTIFELAHPEDRLKVAQRLSDYLERRTTTYEITFRMKHKQGRYIWILARGIAMWDKKGEPYRMVGTFMDLTKQKKIENELRKNEKRLRRSQQLSHLGTIEWDIMADSVHLSEELWQIADRMATNKILSFETFLNEFVYSDDREAVREITLVVIKEHKPMSIEHRIIRPNGDIRYVYCSAEAIYDEKHNPLYFIIAIQDITERKQIELNLKQAKESAEKANQAKSVFLASMSHELRTPLNGILGYTQILNRDDSLTNKQRSAIETIHRSGEHLLTLINDILDLSKIEAGKLELVSHDFNLPYFLQDIVDLFTMRAQQKGIEFIYEQSPDFISQTDEDTQGFPVIIRTDEKRLRQILLNLLSNAVKFTRQGNVKLHIAHHGNQLYVNVTDTGVGIVKKEIKTIFLPFQQVGNHEAHAEGTGLGLPITKKLVMMMGGELQVKSEMGQGSEFSFHIPLLVTRFTQLATKTQKNDKIIDYQCKDGKPVKIKILIVDDNQINREILINLLQPLKFTIETAVNGQDALDKAHSFRPDMILMDLKMPVMDGFTCAQHLRQTSIFSEVIIIALSASTYEHDRERSLEAGCDEFLSKPIDEEELFNIIKHYLNISWVYDALPIAMDKLTLSVEKTISLPPQEKITDLFELAKVGHIRAVIDQATTLQNENPEWQAFTSEVIQLAQTFKSKKLKTLLQQYLSES